VALPEDIFLLPSTENFSGDLFISPENHSLAEEFFSAEDVSFPPVLYFLFPNALLVEKKISSPRGLLFSFPLMGVLFGEISFAVHRFS